MSYAIIGFGAIGQALARAFARKNIQVSVATRNYGDGPYLRLRLSAFQLVKPFPANLACDSTTVL
jgi:pyrroline-5-carboxylate reductase